MRNTLRTEPNVRRRPSRRTTPNKQIGRTLPRKRAEPDGTFRNLEVRELKPSEKGQKPERSDNREAAETEAVREPERGTNRSGQPTGE